MEDLQYWVMYFCTQVKGAMFIILAGSGIMTEGFEQNKVCQAFLFQIFCFMVVFSVVFTSPCGYYLAYIAALKQNSHVQLLSMFVTCVKSEEKSKLQEYEENTILPLLVRAWTQRQKYIQIRKKEMARILNLEKTNNKGDAIMHKFGLTLTLNNIKDSDGLGQHALSNINTGQNEAERERRKALGAILAPYMKNKNYKNKKTSFAHN